MANFQWTGLGATQGAAPTAFAADWDGALTEWEVQADVSAETDGTSLVFTGTANVRRFLRLLSAPQALDPATDRVDCRFRFYGDPSVTTLNIPRLFASSVGGIENAIYVDVWGERREVRLSQYHNDSFEYTYTGIVLPAGAGWFRGHVRWEPTATGKRAKIKIWPDSHGEPLTWQFESDPAFEPQVGDIGVGVFTSATHKMDWISFGTGIDDAAVLGSAPVGTPGDPISLDHMTYGANIDPGNVTITNPSAGSPLIEVTAARADTSGWINFHFALDNANGKLPDFGVTSDRNFNWDFQPGWKPMYTYDFKTWYYASGFGESGGNYTFRFNEPFTQERVYIASHPLFRQQDFEDLATSLLTRSVVTPAASANGDPQGIIGQSELETDNLGRQVGGHNIYALKLDWGGTTTDGGPKRQMAMVCGTHPGETIDGFMMKGFLDWVLDDPSPEAAQFRSNWVVHLYTPVCPNGRAGGHRRHNFRSNVDPNRDWENMTLSENLLIANSIKTDLGLPTGRFDVFYGWHGAGSRTVETGETCFFFAGNMDAGAQVRFKAALDTVAPQPSVNLGEGDTPLAGTEAGWAASNGAHVAMDPEGHMRGTGEAWRYEDQGRYYAQTTVILDSQNEFGTDPNYVEPTPDPGDLVFDFTIDAGNLDPVASTITDPALAEPTVTVVPRAQTLNTYGLTWKQFSARLTGASGKRPIININTQYLGNLDADLRIWYSYDQHNWTRWDSGYTSGGTNVIQFQLTTAFTQGSVYVALHPAYPFSHYKTRIIDFLDANYPALLHRLPSTGPTDQWSAGTVNAQVDDLGRTIGPLPMHSFGLWDDTKAPADGSPKRTIVLTNGIHPGEHLGAWSFDALIHFLVSGDPKAVSLLTNFEFVCYPCLNPIGWKGGHFRGQWDTYDDQIDPNRDVIDEHLQSTQVFKDAMRLDLAGRHVKIALDFHSWAYIAKNNPTFYIIRESMDSGAKTAWTNAVLAYANYEETLSTAMGSVGQSMADQFNVLMPITVENVERQNSERITTLNDWTVSAEHWAKSFDDIWQTEQDGLFAITDPGPIEEEPGMRSVLDFTGGTSGNQVAVNASAIYSGRSTAFTVEFWVKFNTVAPRVGLVHQYDTLNNQRGFMLDATDDGRLLFTGSADGINIQSGEILVGGTGWAASTWYHIAFVWLPGAYPSAYINGSFATGTGSGGASGADTLTQLYASTAPLVFGNVIYTTGRTLDGYMLDVRFWDHQRTAQQVTSTKDVALSGTEAGLLGYWKLDEGTGFVAADSSVKANNGTISGATWVQTEDPLSTATAVPQGMVTLGAPSVTATSATVPLTYAGTDATAFEYRLNGGAAVNVGMTNQLDIVGLTAETVYQVEARAINALGAGAWSAVVSFTTAAAGTTPVGETYLKDFATLSVGALPVDLVPGQTTAGITWHLADAGGSTVLRASGDTTESRRILAFTDAPLATGTVEEATLEFSVTGKNVTGTHTGLVMRLSGAVQSESFYFFHVRTDTDRIEFARYNGGSYTQLHGAEYPWAANVAYRMRFRIETQGSNVLMQARIWEKGSPESTGWDLVFTDSGSGVLTQPGQVGVTTYHHAGSNRDFSFLGYAHSGEVAPVVSADESLKAPATAFGNLSGTTLALNWSSASGATGYEYELRTGGVTVTGPFDTGISSSVVTATALSEVDAPEFRVRAYNAVEPGPYTAWQPVTFTDLLVLHDFDGGSIDPAGTVMTGTETTTPDITFKPRAVMTEFKGAPKWRNFQFRVDGVQGKQPTFSFDGTDYWASVGSTWRPWYSYDNVNWYWWDTSTTTSGAVTSFQLGSAFTQNTVYIGFNPGYPVSRSKDLIGWLETNHSNLVHRPPSVGTDPDWAGGWMSQQTDELGRVIPSQPIRAFGIWDDTAYTGDTAAKRTIVLAGGTHAGEGFGNLPLESFVRELVSGSAAGQAMLQKFHFLVYPVLNPMGIYGGHPRGDWDPNLPNTDPNRDWSVSGFTLESTQIAKSMIDKDFVGHNIAVLLSFHAFGLTPGSAPVGIYELDSTYAASFEAALDAHQDYGFVTSGSTGTMTRYFYNEYGTGHSYTIESIERFAHPTDTAGLELVGSELLFAMNTLSDTNPEQFTGEAVTGPDDPGTPPEDTTAPVISVNNLSTVSANPTITGTCDDATATLVLTVAGASYNPVPNGTTWSRILPEISVGTYDMTLTATDPVGNQSTAEGTLTIQSGEGLLEGQRWQTGEIVSLDLSTEFAGATGYTLTGLPVGSGLSFDTSTGVLSGTPNTTDNLSSPYWLTVGGSTAAGQVSKTFEVTAVAGYHHGYLVLEGYTINAGLKSGGVPRFAPDNSAEIRIDRITDANQQTVTGAPVKFTLMEADAVDVVAGRNWPMTLVPSADGSYSGVLPANLNIFPGSMYILRAEAAVMDAVLQQDLYVVAMNRRG